MRNRAAVVKSLKRRAGPEHPGLSRQEKLCGLRYGVPERNRKLKEKWVLTVGILRRRRASDPRIVGITQHRMLQLFEVGRVMTMAAAQVEQPEEGNWGYSDAR